MDKKLLTFAIIIELLYCINAQFYLIPIPQNPSTSYNLITTNNYNQYHTFPYDVNYLGPEYDYTAESEDIDNSTQKEIWLDDAGYEQNLLDGLDNPDILPDYVSSDMPTKCPKCDCGLRYRYRIVGGQVTEKYEFPWMILIGYKNEFICGGSLINDRYVLTAAHCVIGIDMKQLVLAFNVYDRYALADTKYVVREVVQIIHHNYQGNQNDIALMKFTKPLNFKKALARPICLQNQYEALVGKTAVAAGWGSTSENGETSGKLRKVYLPVISNSECKKKYGSKITASHICAGRKSGGQDACQGDSGGPLMVVKGKKFRLIGITSWGEGCARPNTPGVYTRVPSYLKWIADNTKDACTCT